MHPQYAADVVLGPAAAQQRLGKFGHLFGRGESHIRRIVALARGPDIGLGPKEASEFLFTGSVVEADADVRRPDEIGDVVDVIAQRRRADIVVAEEDADAVDADHPAGLGAGSDLIVTNVALVVIQCARVRVGKDDRCGRYLHCFHGRAVGGMRAIDHHADAVHFGHHGAAEVGQANVGVVAAAAGKVVAIVGEQHLAHAQIVVEADKIEGAVERVHAFDVETDGEPTRGLGGIDVGDGSRKRVGLGVCATHRRYAASARKVSCQPTTS